MSQIRFQIVPPIDRPESPIFITGSHPSLGEWKQDRALKLNWAPPFHVGEIESDTGHHFDYKITRGSWETEAVDALTCFEQFFSRRLARCHSAPHDSGLEGQVCWATHA